MLDTGMLGDAPPESATAGRIGRAAFSRALGANLRVERLARGLSLPDVERLFPGDLKRGTLRSWESGDREMPAERLVAVAAFYGVPAAGLVPSWQQSLP